MAVLRLFAFVLSLRLLTGPVSEDVDTRLRKAKTLYEERMSEAVASIHRKLDAKENQARLKGDKKLVDQIKKESEAVDEALAVPASVDVETHLSEIKRARSAMLKEYDQAIKECLKAKADEEATSYEVEKNDFIRAFLKSHRGIAGSLGTRWVHSSGSFEEDESGNWVETLKVDPPKQLKFLIAKRMNDHVVLHDPRRKCTVWIYPDRCVVKLGTAEPREFYKGSWVR